MNKEYKLIIFDLDGTLADQKTSDLLPGVKQWFDEHPNQWVAIATNQGGAGLRHWMERDGFGKPEEYPTEEMVWAHIKRVLEQLPRLSTSIPTYVCFRYQSKTSGKWGPAPRFENDTIGMWSREWRKPAPGMLLYAMQESSVEPADTLMVGDWEEDQQAAQAAGCDFMWAKDFFKRQTVEEQMRGLLQRTAQVLGEADYDEDMSALLKDIEQLLGESGDDQVRD